MNEMEDRQTGFQCEVLALGAKEKKCFFSSKSGKEESSLQGKVYVTRMGRRRRKVKRRWAV